MYKTMIRCNSSMKKGEKEQKNNSNQRKSRNREEVKNKTKIQNYPKEIKAISMMMNQKQ